MDTITKLKNQKRLHIDLDSTNFNADKSFSKKSAFNPAIIKMVAEGGESFFRYIKKVNLSKESDILVLPSKEHYYYEEKELSQFTTIINLRKLNHIKNPGNFLQNLTRILNDNVNFIGCFSDDQTIKGNNFLFNQPSILFRRFINLIDAKTDHIMNKKEVTDLLEKHGFKVINMTEINGLIYFYSQNVRRHA